MNTGLAVTVALLLVLSISTVQGQETSSLQSQYQYSVAYIDKSIQLDGKLEDEVWEEVDAISDFWMSFPVDDRKVDSSLQTIVQMYYDHENIYISAVCKGAGPYVIPSLKRDNMEFWQGDAFGIVIDPVNQKTSGFSFATNPAGVQTESLVSGQTGLRGSQRNSGIDRAWDNKWYCRSHVEADQWTTEIIIPFRSLRFGSNGTWGINFIRGDSKTNSYHTWSPVPVQFRGVDLGYTGAIHWETPPERVRGNIAVIPYVLGSTSRDFEEGTGKQNDLQIGGDAKVAVTSSLNLDLTLNPDFSQVEVDEQVTNLTTINPRFPEKRLFFLENADVFGEYGIPPMRPFFSRRIGLDVDGNTIPILFGARLSGNLNKDLRIGIMNMQTKSSSVSPGQNYSATAFQQRILKRSVVKGYFNNRQTFDQGEFTANDYNRTTGLELDINSADGKWRALAGYGLSFSPDKEGDNYFFNGSLTYNGRNLRLYSNAAGIGNNYRADMGWIPRIEHKHAVLDTVFEHGFNHFFNSLSYIIYPENRPKVNFHELSFDDRLDMTKGGQLIENRLRFRYRLNWQNSSRLEVELTNTASNLLYPFDFTDFEPLPAGKYVYNFVGLKYESDRRKILSYEAGVEFGKFYNGNRKQFQAKVNLRQQPWGNFGLNFVQNYLEFPDPYGNVELLLLGPKIELAFSRDLFWTTFVQYNTQNDNFNINSRFQWRFQPLSDIFIVYTDNYAVNIWGPKNRAFVVKMNYWLNL